MKMRCKYAERDLAQRLEGTICRYRDIPYIVRCPGGRELELRKLGSGETAWRIYYDDPDFDISSVPLGFIQSSKDTVAYVSRRPARVWKQGISNDNVIFNYLSQAGRARAANGLQSVAFEDMVLGKYPSIESTLKMFSTLDDQDAEIAVSRDIALRWNHKLKLTYVYYKQEQVGFIVFGTNKVIVPGNEFGWIISQHLAGFTWEVE